MLLAISALACFAAWLIGKAAEARDLAPSFQANSIRHRRVLSTVFLGLAAIRQKIVFTRQEIEAVLSDFAGPGKQGAYFAARKA